MSELGSKANEFGGIQKQKDSLSRWIETTENSVADFLTRPSKFRPDAAQMEINMITDMQQTLLEKQAVLEDIASREEVQDYDLKIALDTLDEHISMLLEKRYNQQAVVEDFRFYYQDSQTWFESISKNLTELDENNEMNSSTRMEKLLELVRNYEENMERSTVLSEKSKYVLAEVGEMDQQQVLEQTRAVERRMVDFKKRIERKKQLVEMAQIGFKTTEQDIADAEAWMENKLEELNTRSNLSFEDRLSELKALTKEIDNKSMVIESFETKIDTISSDLESSECSELKRKLEKLSIKHSHLANLAKDNLKQLTDSSDYQKKFKTDFGDVENWLRIKTSEFTRGVEFDPLKAYDVEKRVARIKKDLNEVSEFEESKVSQVKLGIINLQKNGDDSMKKQIDEYSKEINSLLSSLKEGMKKRIIYLEDRVESRREFEMEFDKCVAWLDQADAILSTEVRGNINIAILDEHHNKFRKLKRDEEENRERVTEVFEKAKEIMNTLCDADRIILQSQMDDVCDKQNHVADTVQAKIENLVRNISIYKLTAQKIEDSVNHLTEIQRQIRLLNKPIGYRVEDAEDVLDAYEKILSNLKDFKVQMEDLQKNAGTNVNELKALLNQQEELIGAIENQMLKIRNLITVRHQFMTMITGITSFIIKHTEVVKEIERSSIQPLEKVSKYEDSISKLKDCETQLALASDKGQQIANEGSTADRNQITQQLQSLKTQILTLKRAIEKKRDEHIKSVAEHNKVFTELEDYIDWINEKECEFKSQPLLKTTVEDVESHILKHKELTNTVMETIEKIIVVNEAARKETDLSPRIFELLSSAGALIQTVPRDLESRRIYLDKNKNLRFVIFIDLGGFID